MNTLGDHIRTRRLDLGLLQSQVVEQIGVHKLTITNWEGNASQPAVRYIPVVIRFLGYNPAVAGTSTAQRMISARKVLGLSQRKMAERLGVDPGTLQGWETGQHEPSRKMRRRIEETLPHL